MPIKDLFKTIIFIALIIGGLVLYSNKTFSYSPSPTHYNLAKESIELYNLIYDPDITPRQLELILKGSMNEDVAPRWSFHLYDPIYNRAPFGAATAKIWALDPDFQGDFIHTLANLLLNIFTKNEDDLKMHDNYSWLASIKYYNKGETGKAYYGLGHVLHLIADMSVPAHSRNDHHVTGDPFESWAAGIDFSSGDNTELAESLYKNKYRLSEIYSINQIFDELSRYSNKYFFSKDSIIGTDLYEDYNWPKIIKEERVDLGKYLQRTYAMTIDNSGSYIYLAYKDYYKSMWREIVPGEEKNENVYILDDQDVKINESYWTRLAPKAVQYGAGAIKLFLEEIGKEVAIADPSRYSSSHLPLIASVFQPPIIQGEVKGESIEKQETQPEEINQINEINETHKIDEADFSEDAGTNESGTVVSGPILPGDGWSAPAGNQTTESDTIPELPEEPEIPGPSQEPQDTTPPDVSLDSLIYDYKLSFLIISWSSSEIPSISFDVEYKQEGEGWQPLLINIAEIQASLSIARDTFYSFRVKATDSAGNESEWQEKSIKINPGPSPIIDLNIDYENNIFITLKWSAPYSENPPASLSYDIRYSEEPLIEDNWNSANPVSNFAFSEEVPAVENPEIIQNIDITPLKFNSIYYFAIKTFDGIYNSNISNVLEYSTGPQPTLMKSTWPAFQKNPQSTGFVPYSGPGFLSSESVTLKLVAELSEPLYVPPVIDVEGNIYSGGAMKFYSINSRNGEIKWFYDFYNYNLNWGGVSYSGTLDSDGTFYETSYGGTFLYALTPSGKLKWKYRIGGPNDGGSVPIIGSDGTIYVSSREQGYVYAINPDGTEKWKYFIVGANLVSSPALGSDNTIYVAWKSFGFTGYISAIDSEGNLRWQSEDINPDTYAGLSVDASDNIYFSSNYYSAGYLRSLRPTDGVLNWSAHLSGTVHSPASIDQNGNIYIATKGGAIFILNSDGTQNEAIYTGNEIFKPLIIDIDGIIYSVSGKKILAFYPDGTEKWSHEFDIEITTSPIMDESGTIYVFTSDGKIWAIGD